MPADLPPDRPCPSCGVAYEPELFYHYSDGSRFAKCKECKRAGQRWYTAEHREENRQRGAAYRERNLDRLHAYDRERYYADHAEHRRRRNESARKNGTQWDAARKAKIAADPRFAAAQGERVRRNKAIYRQRNRSQLNRAALAYHHSHPHVGRKAAAVARARKRGAIIEDVDPRVVYGRDEGRCRYCGIHLRFAAFESDHVVPLSQGGAHAYSNVVASCGPCNGRKGPRTPEQAGMKLL